MEKYPKTSRELIKFIKRKHKKEENLCFKLLRHIPEVNTFSARDQWPMQFSRLEYNGEQVRSIIVQLCGSCGHAAVVTSKVDNGSGIQNWRCMLCNKKCHCKIISN